MVLLIPDWYRDNSLTVFERFFGSFGGNGSGLPVNFNLIGARFVPPTRRTEAESAL
jgi:hypothetical protein